jgi:formiminotetrahydrofolate cyclodeaminase
LNVLTNAKDLEDRAWAEDVVSKAQALLKANHNECDAIVNAIETQFLNA